MRISFKKLTAFFLSAALFLAACPFLIAAASDDLSFSAGFWNGAAADSDNYLQLTTGGNLSYWTHDEYITGNYTLEYEFKDMSPWIKSGGVWQNVKGGSETWIVLGAKKKNGRWQDFVGTGADGICLRITDGSIFSHDFVGGPYPFYYPGDELIPEIAWRPAGEFARLIDARVIYRFVVKADIRKIEIWAGFKDVSEPDLQFQYRGYMTYGDAARTDGYFMMNMYTDSLVDNYKIIKDGDEVVNWAFDDGKLPAAFDTNLPPEAVNIVNGSKTLTTGAPLSSGFYVRRDYYSAGDYMWDCSFRAQSGSGGDTLDFIFGKTGAAENAISFTKNAQALTLNGAPETGTAGAGAFDLTHGAWFRVAMAKDGTLEVFVIDKVLRCPAEHCPQSLLNAYSLDAGDLEGALRFAAQGTVVIEGFAVAAGSVGADSVIRGLTINTGEFVNAKVGKTLNLSAAFDMSQPLLQNQGLYWKVDSGDAEITGGDKLKINGTGTVVVRAISVFDPGVFATAEVYVPEIQKIIIDGSFSKAIGGTVRLKAFVVCKPNVEEFAAVKWQVIEGDAELAGGNELKINGAGRITVKAISLIDKTANAEYSFIAGQTGTGETPPSGGGLWLFISLLAAAVLSGAGAAAFVIVKTKTKKT